MQPRPIAAVVVLGLVFGLIATALLGCSERATASQSNTAAPTLRIAASITPLQSLAASLAPKGATVDAIIPPSTSPHGAELTPSAVQNLLAADVVVLVGGGFEPQIDRVLYSRPSDARVVIRLTDQIADDERGITSRCAACEQNRRLGIKTEHTHEHAMDLHAWLDPVIVRRFVAGPLSQSLGAAPGALLAEIDAVDTAYREQIGALNAPGIVALHDAYGRPAWRYGFTIESVLQPLHAIEPTPQELATAAGSIRSGTAQAIAVEPLFSSAAATRLGELTGAAVIRLNPIGDGAPGGWAQMMLANLDALVKGLTRPDFAAH